ncbi:estrogen sulfotransferase-like [Argonauta hians]
MSSSLISMLEEMSRNPKAMMNLEMLKSFTAIRDNEGNQEFAIKYNDMIYPPIPTLMECLPRIPTFQKRPDDTFICAYPYSGTHWLWEVASMVARKKAERITGVKEEMMLEVIPQSTLDNVESPRVLNTHILPSILPEDLLDNGRIIFVMRNPKDVVVSAFRQTTGAIYSSYKGTFANFFEMFIQGKVYYGDYFKYNLSWLTAVQGKPNVLVVSYEEASQDLEKVVTRISEFLQADLNPELCREITELCTFKRMKAEKLSENVGPIPVKLWKPNVSFYRTGKVATWKDWLTVTQSETLDRLMTQFQDFSVPIKCVI